MLRVMTKAVGQDVTVYMKVKKTSSLRKLMYAYCNQMGLNMDLTFFYSNGERVDPMDTAEMLGLEDPGNNIIEAEFFLFSGPLPPLQLLRPAPAPGNSIFNGWPPPPQWRNISPRGRVARHVEELELLELPDDGSREAYKKAKDDRCAVIMATASLIRAARKAEHDELQEFFLRDRSSEGDIVRDALRKMEANSKSSAPVEERDRLASSASSSHATASSSHASSLHNLASANRALELGTEKYIHRMMDARWKGKDKMKGDSKSSDPDKMDERDEWANAPEVD